MTAVGGGEDEAKTLGRWIRGLRERTGRTTGEIALEAGISQRELERWEKGANSSQALAFTRLLDALGINLDQPDEIRPPLSLEIRSLAERVDVASAQVRAELRELGEGLQLDLRLLQRSVTVLVEKAEGDVRLEQAPVAQSQHEDAPELDRRP